MRIRLHLMGPLKQKYHSLDCPKEKCEMEVNENSTPRDLLKLFGITQENIVAMINGKAVDLDLELADQDRVALMLAQSRQE